MREVGLAATRYQIEIEIGGGPNRWVLKGVIDPFKAKQGELWGIRTITLTKPTFSGPSNSPSAPLGEQPPANLELGEFNGAIDLMTWFPGVHPIEEGRVDRWITVGQEHYELAGYNRIVSSKLGAFGVEGIYRLVLPDRMAPSVPLSVLWDFKDTGELVKSELVINANDLTGVSTIRLVISAYQLLWNSPK